MFYGVTCAEGAVLVGQKMLDTVFLVEDSKSHGPLASARLRGTGNGAGLRDRKPVG